MSVGAKLLASILPSTSCNYSIFYEGEDTKVFLEFGAEHIVLVIAFNAADGIFGGHFESFRIPEMVIVIFEENFAVTRMSV